MPGPMSLTAEEVAQMLSRSNDNMAPNIIACCSISLSVAIVSVGLRLWSRRVLNGRFHLDVSDWLAMTALFLHVVYVTSVIMTTRHGLGRHMIFAHPRLMSIYTIISENLYASILAHLKYSVLFILATNLQCIPISAMWDPTIHDTSTCINYGVEALVAYIINIVTDLTIIGMPIPLIIRLNTSKSQKCRLIIVFAFWDYVLLAILALIEIMVGFLATSIATYRPLYHLITKGSTTEYIGDSHSTDRVTDGRERPTQRAQLSTDIRGGVESRLNSSIEPPPQGICVTIDVELTVQDSVQGPWVRTYDRVEPLDRGHIG
ncbi:uncharacterized protein F4817DRAFT_365102, partial [Daldinia loculata]|uniref:uncharacterized protein n=1 Tax=Daldinia loculata TaxID=103429 RepID=UPI0020C3B2FA